MCVKISVGGELTRDIQYNNGVKQGCILAPTLFSLFATALFTYAFENVPEEGIYIRSRMDGSLYNLRRLQSSTKCTRTLMREFQYADDCVFVANSEESLQRMMDSFEAATKSFGVIINTKKTEVMSLSYSPIISPITVNDTPLANVQSFKYLGSTVTSDCSIDKELDNRIQCASSSFGRLWKRLWSSHDIKVTTKIAVYNAVVLSTLLYGAESWTLYRRHVTRLRQLQQRHLRAILRISYQQRVTNDEVLTRANSMDIEITLAKMQLRWAGHVARMANNRLPKQLLFGELAEGKRRTGRPLLRWKDSLKYTLKTCQISIDNWQLEAADRYDWRDKSRKGLNKKDDLRRRSNAVKRSRRHATRNASTVADSGEFRCQHCNRTCASRIGMLSHERACGSQ